MVEDHLEMINRNIFFFTLFEFITDDKITFENKCYTFFTILEYVFIVVQVLQ